MLTKRTKVFSNFSYVDLYPVQFGYEACQPSHAKPRSKFNNFIFHIIIEGRGSYHNEKTGEREELNPGQGFLIYPGTISSYQADLTKPWTYYWIEFNGIKAKSFMELAGFTSHRSIYQLKNPRLLGQYTKLFETILIEESEALLMAYTYQIMHFIMEESVDHRPPQAEDSHNFYIKEAVKYISRHYQSNISVEDVADHCNLSRTYLTKLFKKKVSLTPSKYISQFRLSKAVEYLKDPHMSMADIAEAIGYSNQFVFSNAFKKQYGQSPTDWRNNQAK